MAFRGFYGFGEIQEQSLRHSGQSGDFCHADNIVGLAGIPRLTDGLVVRFAEIHINHRKRKFENCPPEICYVSAESKGGRSVSLVCLGISATPTILLERGEPPD